VAAAMQTESQIISSSLIRDDRETRKTKRRREKRREKKTYENENDKKEKKKTKNKREKNNPSLRCCASEYETTKANLVQGQQTLCATSH